MDPRTVLGVSPSADLDEVNRAYREQAKRYHPDRRPEDATAAQQMAAINAAYAVLTAGLAAEATSARAEPPPVDDAPANGGPDARVRAALGPELLGGLEPGERVLMITDAASYESPRVRLVLTDRRLVWLMADAPVERVRNIPWRKVERVDGRVRGRIRKTGELVVEPRHGKRITFGEIAPAALEQLLDRIPS